MPNVAAHFQTFLKTTFNNVTMTQWGLVDGGSLSTGCGVIMDGLSLNFNGVGLRQVETEELDLRDAR